MELNFELMREFSEEQFYSCAHNDYDLSKMIYFHYRGVDIVNPFLDESGRYNVDPIEYYGDAFLNSDFCKKFTL